MPLSRACLGKNDRFQYKVSGSKRCFAPASIGSCRAYAILSPQLSPCVLSRAYLGKRSVCSLNGATNTFLHLRRVRLSGDGGNKQVVDDRPRVCGAVRRVGFRGEAEGGAAVGDERERDARVPGPVGLRRGVVVRDAGDPSQRDVRREGDRLCLGCSSGRCGDAPARKRLVPQLFLCLSRAYLGKLIAFSIERVQTRASSAHSGNRRVGSADELLHLELPALEAKGGAERPVPHVEALVLHRDEVEVGREAGRAHRDGRAEREGRRREDALPALRVAVEIPSQHGRHRGSPAGVGARGPRCAGVRIGYERNRAYTQAVKAVGQERRRDEASVLRPWARARHEVADLREVGRAEERWWLRLLRPPGLLSGIAGRLGQRCSLDAEEQRQRCPRSAQEEPHRGAGWFSGGQWLAALKDCT